LDTITGLSPVTISLFTDSSGGAPNTADLVALAGGSIVDMVPDGTAAALRTVDFTANNVLVPADSTLVVVVSSPDLCTLNGANNFHFNGANDAGESGPSYIKSASCGLPDFATLASIGFPDQHMVMTVELDTVAGPTEYDNGPPEDDFGAPASQYASDFPFSAETADDVTIAGPGGPVTISAARFWVTYFNFTGTPNPAVQWTGVTVTVYADAGGSPSENRNDDGTFTGAPVATQTVGMGSVTVAPALVGGCVEGFGFPSFQIDVDLSLTVDYNTPYWIVFQPEMIFVGTGQVGLVLSQTNTGAGAQQSFPVAAIPPWTPITGNVGTNGPCSALPPGSLTDIAFLLTLGSPQLDPPTAGLGIPMSRYISITPTNAAVAGPAATSIQVEIVSMKTCSAGAVNPGQGCEINTDCPSGTCGNSPAIGQIWWAGPEGAIANPPSGPALRGAALQCTASPHSQVWTSGHLYLYGTNITPSSSYNVRMCDDNGINCSDPLLVTTGEWGNVDGVGGPAQPNFGDTTFIVQKFQNVAGSLITPRVDLVGPDPPPAGDPNMPNQVADFGDISACVSAFIGNPGGRYRFTVATCP